MNEYRPHARIVDGRFAVLVSRYNEVVTLRLLDGVRLCFKERGVPSDLVDIIWVPGTFELVGAAAVIAEARRHVAIIAIGAVIRGETPHFDFISHATANGLAQVSVLHRLPVAFGVLTTEDLAQAISRAGGSMGNKGYDAGLAALELADVMDQIKGAAD
jgi:6,7-dimethyl-8-ribityllumazine synthase